MKSILLFLSICSAVQMTAQKEYDLNYLVNYEVTNYKDSTKSYKKTILSNSKNNSYHVELKTVNDVRSRLEFVDFNGLYSVFTFITKSLGDGNLALTCSDLVRLNNPYKYQTKNYDFKVLQDTIIQDVRYQQYKLSSNKEKRAKRKKLGQFLYIVEATQDHLPFLQFITGFEEWQTNQNLPKGVLKELHFYNWKGDLEYSEKAISVEKIQRKLIIPNNCEL